MYARSALLLEPVRSRNLLRLVTLAASLTALGCGDSQAPTQAPPSPCVGDACSGADETAEPGETMESADAVEPAEAMEATGAMEPSEPMEPADTPEPDQTTCEAGATQTMPCGLNGRGTQILDCVDGAFRAQAACEDSDECVDGRKLSSIPCGLDGKGSQAMECKDGRIAPAGECATDGECMPGETGPTLACGLNGRGTGPSVCLWGRWGGVEDCDDPDECIDGTDLPSETCGLNGRGTQEFVCMDGKKTHAASCVDPDECTDGAVGAQGACGLNGRGTGAMVCRLGSWAEATDCDDPDECLDGQTLSSVSCGLNGRGQQARSCDEGRAVMVGGCVDSDECVDGTLGAQSACGLNGNGSGQALCQYGRWGAVRDCDDPDECRDGDYVGYESCGLNGRGYQERQCQGGKIVWVGECRDSDECRDQDSVVEACGLNGRGSTTKWCSYGQWDDGLCDDPDQCVDATTKQESCGPNHRGLAELSCVAGIWETDSCTDTDECKDGSQTSLVCDGDGMQTGYCYEGSWGPVGDCCDVGPTLLPAPMLTSDSVILGLFALGCDVAVVTEEGVTTVDRAGEVRATWTAPRPLTASAFDGSLLVVADGAKLTTLDVSLQEVASGTLTESCSDLVMVSDHRVVCGPSNDWDRVFYVYDALTMELIRSSGGFTYNGIPMGRVPGTSDFVTVTTNLSPSDYHLYRVDAQGTVRFLGESPYHGDISVSSTYGFNGSAPTHLITTSGVMLRMYTDESARDIVERGPFVKDGVLGTGDAYRHMTTGANGNLLVINWDNQLQEIDVANRLVVASTSMPEVLQGQWIGNFVEVPTWQGAVTSYFDSSEDVYVVRYMQMPSAGSPTN